VLVLDGFMTDCFEGNHEFFYRDRVKPPPQKKKKKKKQKENLVTCPKNKTGKR